jgi:hypothetical protein
MRRLKCFFSAFVFLILLSCNNSDNSKIIRKDLLKNIEEFIAYSEEHISNYKTNETDTDIYWVEFFEKDNKDVVVIMQQPYYHSQNNDGFIEIADNLVFFHFSNKDFVDVSKLKKNPPSDTPDENSRMAGLGYSAPNWAYYITDNGLEKFELGQ